MGPDRTFDVVVQVDLEAIAKRLGAQAANSKSRRSKFMHGAVEVRIVKEVL